jgi:hypothetical protein
LSKLAVANLDKPKKKVKEVMANDLFERELLEDMNRNPSPAAQDPKNYQIRNEIMISPSQSELVKSKNFGSSNSRDRRNSSDHLNLKIDPRNSSMNRSKFRNSISAS